MICSKKNAFFDFFDFCIEGSPLWIDFGKICRRENFWNFQKKIQKWPVQDSSNIARNKLIKNQPVWGTHWWAANDKPPRGGVSPPPPCKIGLKRRIKLPRSRLRNCIRPLYSFSYTVHTSPIVQNLLICIWELACPSWSGTAWQYFNSDGLGNNASSLVCCKKHVRVFV